MSGCGARGVARVLAPLLRLYASAVRGGEAEEAGGAGGAGAGAGAGGPASGGGGQSAVREELESRSSYMRQVAADRCKFGPAPSRHAPARGSSPAGIGFWSLTSPRPPS